MHFILCHLLPPVRKPSILKEQICSFESKFFPLRADPFLEVAAENQTVLSQKLSLYENGGNLPRISIL